MSGFLSIFTRGRKARAEKRRLEAFFSAMPMEYCGWGPNGTMLYSRGFTKLLGIDRLQTIHDVENALEPSDAAALEGVFLALTRQNETFSITVRTHESGHILKLSGSKGQDLGMSESYDILWLQDITDMGRETDELKEDLHAVKSDANKMRLVLDSYPMPVWFSDSLNDISWANTAYQKTVEKDLDDITNATLWLPITLPGSEDDPKTHLRDLIKKAKKEQETQKTRARLIVNGKRRMIEFTCFPIEGQDLIVTLGQDVTSEEDNKAEHKRYVTAQAKLLEQLNSAVAIFAADQRLEFHNSAFGQLWGTEDSWLNEKPKLGDFMEKLRDERKLPEQADFRSFKKSWLDMFTGLLNPHEEMLYLPNDTALRMLVVPHPMGGLMMTFEDVTSRLALESSYNTLMAVQRETLENLAEGVVVFGSDGRMKLSNPQFATMWDLNPEDMEGEPHVTQLVEKQRKFFKVGWQDVEDILTAQGLSREELTHELRRDDDTVLECFSVPMPDGGMMVTHRDITDKIRVEIALREKALALEEAEKLKTDFLANASYQLRTPLNAMTGFAEILSNNYFGELNDKQREYTKGILEAGHNLMTLIDDILDLSSIEAGYLSLRLESIDLHTTLNDVFELTREWAGRETLKATLDCPKDIGIIRADERRVKQILVNLIRNAISFTPGGGKVEIKASGTSDAVEISVTDTGIGISSDDQDALFQPFKRSATTTAQGNAAGPGLGLSLVQNIVSLHGGHVSLDSELGEGTTVTITLPRSGPEN